MPRRPKVGVDSLQQRWGGSGLAGGLLGIASVIAATAGIGLVCALIALIVALVY